MFRLVLVAHSDFNVARILGLIGAILIVVGVIISLLIPLIFIGEVLREIREPRPFSPFEAPPSGFRARTYINFPPLSLVGWVLLIASLYLFSRVYSEDRIFYYAIYSVVSIVGGVILAVILLFTGAALFKVLIGILFIIAAFIAFIGGTILMGYFTYKSLNLLAEKPGKELFRTAGILMLVAAITLIIFIGMLFELLGAIVLTIAFYTLKPPQSQKPVEETSIKSVDEGLQPQEAETSIYVKF